MNVKITKEALEPPMKIKTFESEKEFIAKSCTLILKALKTGTRPTIALSGGSTPKPIYEALAKNLKKNHVGRDAYEQQLMLRHHGGSGVGSRVSTKTPADKIQFFQIDERHVPKNHKDSNYKLITESLIKLQNSKNKSSGSSSTNFHHFDTSLPIKKSLEKYSKELPKTGFNISILGIGTDGHTASLFPKSPALQSKSKVAHTTTKKFAVKDRLTITFPTILKSKKLLVLLKGKDKKAILEKLKGFSKKSPKLSEIKNFPALKLLNHSDLTIHYLEN